MLSVILKKGSVYDWMTDTNYIPAVNAFSTWWYHAVMFRCCGIIIPLTLFMWCQTWILDCISFSCYRIIFSVTTCNITMLNCLSVVQFWSAAMFVCTTIVNEEWNVIWSYLGTFTIKWYQNPRRSLSFILLHL